MKTTFNKLVAWAAAVLAAALLFVPMRAGKEPRLIPGVSELTLKPGERFVMNYAFESAQEQAVSFASEAPGIASVDESGMITAVSPGKTRVWLNAEGGLRAQALITVSGVPVTSFRLSVDSLSLNKGDVSGLTCVYNEGASSRGVEWYSANEAVARVDGAGRVTAIGAGETYIVATTDEGYAAAAKVTVNVRGTAVAIIPGDMTLGVGAKLQLRTSLLPEDSTDTPLSWTSSATDVLSVGESGIVHAIAPGVAIVTLHTKSGLANSATITVEPAARNFQLNPTSVVIERGEALALDAQLIGDASSTRHHIDWTSDNPSVATVENGALNAIASGNATITASADGFTAVCRVQVKTTVHKIELDKTEITLLREEAKEPIALNAAITPADADDPRVKFISDNELVATVTDDGVVQPTGGYGTATIIATAAGGAEARFTINVVTAPATPEPTEGAEN